MSPIIWDNCRYPNGNINLRLAARQTGMKVTEQMDSFLTLLEQVQPVQSRQLAALAILTAQGLYATEREGGV